MIPRSPNAKRKRSKGGGRDEYNGEGEGEKDSLTRRREIMGGGALAST